MIRHIVFFSAADAADVEKIQTGLQMLGDIPHSQHFEVGRNMQSDQIAGAHVDVIVYAEFADEAALAAYKADPIYEKCISIVRPMRELRIAADFEATGQH